MPYGFKLPGTDIVKVPNSGGGADPTKLPLAGGTLSNLLNFTGTTHAGIRLNSLTTTQRDALTAGAGDLLFNSTLSRFQGYTGVAWASMAELASNTFTGKQTITQATANTSVLESTGYSLTGSDTTAMVNLAGTWNTTGLATALKLNITKTAANDASKIIDLQVDGASKLSLSLQSGLVLGASYYAQITSLVSSSSVVDFYDLPGYTTFSSSSRIAAIGNIGIRMISSAAYSWSSAGNDTRIASDTFLKRGGAAACVQMGEDAAGVTNQHFKACNRITSNGVGANLTLSGGNGRGGAGGDLILASYTTAGSGVAGTLTTRWRIDAATGKLLPEANATYDLGSDTLNLSSVWSSAFYVGVNQVVGAQGAAVGDAATGAATASFGDVNTALDGIATQLNTLLARVRIHGLIAT